MTRLGLVPSVLTFLWSGLAFCVSTPELPLKDWTVMVYMAADNDLMPYALQDLREIESVATDRTNVIVQLDSFGNEGLRRFRVQDPDSTQVLTEEGAGGEAERFHDFLDWAVSQYPSRHYFIVLWGHGQGWGDGAGGFGGIALNTRLGTRLDIPSLARVLEAVSEKSLNGRSFDFFASDACLMQMAEVAAEIAPSVRFIAGSPQIQVFSGLPYRRLLETLNQVQSSDEPYTVAQMLPRLVEKELATREGPLRLDHETARALTLSSVISSELHWWLLPALQELSETLAEAIEQDPMWAIELQGIIREVPAYLGGARELRSFLRLLAQKWRSGRPLHAALLRKIEQADAALSRSVLSYALGTRFEDAGQELYLAGIDGLSVWLPASEFEYKKRIKTFEASAFYQGTHWNKWLSRLYE